VAEIIKNGKGSPKLINDEFMVPWYMSNGIVKREALDYAMSGCSESRLPNRKTGKTGNSGINYGAVMEMTIRDGRIKIHKDEEFGLKTGDPRTFKTYDDLWNAFRMQLENVIKHCMIQVYTAVALKPKYIAVPLLLGLFIRSRFEKIAHTAEKYLHTISRFFLGFIVINTHRALL
jgi:formate C-acetyltransferase